MSPELKSVSDYLRGREDLAREIREALGDLNNQEEPLVPWLKAVLAKLAEAKA